MRRVLAEKALGWTLIPDDGKGEAWVDANRHLRCWADDWHPDTDWEQCGLVIEAMRAKRWEWYVEDQEAIFKDDDRSTVSVSLSKKGRLNWMQAFDERMARMQCAATIIWDWEAADGD